MKHFRKILLPTDFSETAGAAVDYVREHAAFKKSEVIVVHAFELPFLPQHHVIQLTTREKIEADARVVCERSLAEIVESLAGGDRTARSELRPGHAHEVLLEIAEAEKPDLIVMSSHGYRGVQRFVLGSTTERVLRQASCPVLTVR